MFLTLIVFPSLSVARPNVRLCFATTTSRNVVNVTVGRRRKKYSVEPPLLRVDYWVVAAPNSAFACTSSCLFRPCAVRRISALKTTTGTLLSRCVWVAVPNVRVVGLHDRLHHVGVAVLTRDAGERRSRAGEVRLCNKSTCSASDAGGRDASRGLHPCWWWWW